MLRTSGPETEDGAASTVPFKTAPACADTQSTVNPGPA